MLDAAWVGGLGVFALRWLVVVGCWCVLGFAGLLCLRVVGYVFCSGFVDWFGGWFDCCFVV